jgi:hypothetical protein
VKAAERLARELVRARSMGVCEGCGQKPATDYAHRVGRGQGGAWSAANGLHLCGPGNYGGCHAAPRSLAESLGWVIRGRRDPLTVPAFIWPDPYAPSWVFLTDDGLYVYADQEAVLEAGFDLTPEVPDYRRTA